jgi:hypothetical protein
MAAPEESKKYAHEIGKRFIEIQDEISITELKEGTKAVTAQIGASSSTGSKNYFAINWIGLDKTQYYVRLGYFLEFLYTKIIPTIDSNHVIKSLKIDYDSSTNIIYTLPQQITSDPKVCVFKASYSTANGNYDLFPFIDTQSDFIRSDNFEAKYGLIMNVYFSMDYILDGIESNKDEKGKISLYSVLNLLCQGWNSSTGNYNSLEPIIDTETNTIKLVDSVALPDRDDLLKELKISTELALFDIFRYGTYSTNDKENPYIPHAGFIKDLSFNTTVGSNMATMITVGATANGYVVGEDATALSRMNAGLTDRFKEVIGYPEDLSTSTTVLGTAEKTLKERYEAAITSFNNYVETLSKYEWSQGAIDDFTSLQTQLLEYDQANQVQTAAKDYITKDSTIDQSTLPASANGGFLPFDLSLTMDGLSGMKVYQKFSADTNFLPTNYPESLEFLIKGITHTISNNQWTTNIESFAIPFNPFSATGSLRSSNSGGGSFSTVRGGSSKIIDGVTYKNGEIPESKLRVINNASKYKGDVTSDGGKIRLFEKASIALDRLIIAAEQANIPVKINSGYRTYNDQVRVRAQYPNDSATPGTSNHGFGLAVDFATPGLARIKPGDKLYDWLIINGLKYGFDRIKRESWHWEYQL